MMKKIFTLLVILATIDGIHGQTNYGWVQKSNLPATGRHRSTALSCGNRGYIGLGHINSVAPDVLFQDWWEYDPGTDSWSQKANFGGGLRYHAAGFTIGNVMYVGTGRAPSSVLMNDFWKYDPSANTWTQIPNFPGATRRGAVGFEINGNGYVGTGSYYSDWYRYNPATNSWSSIPSGPSGRISAVGMSLNGKGYCGTGDIGGNSGDWWEYNPATNSWTQKATLTGLPRMEACGFALNGYCFVGTGDNVSSGTNYEDFWAFNPATNSWTQVTNFAGAARRYLVAFTLNGRAYAGTGTSGMNYNDWWEYGTISGEEEITLPQVSVYPVPSAGPVNFSFSKSYGNAFTVILYDMSGRTVRVDNYESCAQFQLERGDLSAGTYTYAITSGSDYLGTGKIIFE